MGIRKLRRHSRCLLQSIAALLGFHYISLLMVLHNLSHLSVLEDDLVSFVASPLSLDFKNIPSPFGSLKTGTKSHSSVPPTLWLIQSQLTEKDEQRRQAIRNTYLSDKEIGSEKNLFCRLKVLTTNYEGVETKEKDCLFIYSFIITDSEAVPAFFENEADVLVWRNQNVAESLVNIQEIMQQHGYEYMVWVDRATFVAPLEIIDLLQSSVSNETVLYHTPDFDMSGMCGGKCLLDREAFSRRGSLLLASSKFIQSIDSRKLSCHPPKQEVQVFIRGCLLESILYEESSAKVETIGHQYAYEDTEEFIEMWEKHIQKRLFYQESINNYQVHHISARFNRDPSIFKNNFQDFKTALFHWGLHASQIYLYEGNFPEFILNDHRWEQHLEFLHDLDLNDLGAGFWFWKAPILEHHLNNLENGDFVIFSNTQFWNHLTWLDELIEAMIERDANMAAYQNNFPENEWTKREVYETQCSGKSERTLSNDQSKQVTAHFMVFRKAPGTMDFIHRFSKFIANYHLLSDERGFQPEIPAFREHRRDQSILSTLLKCGFSEKGKEVFFQQSLKELGWFEAFTFKLEPIGLT